MLILAIHVKYSLTLSMNISNVLAIEILNVTYYLFTIE